MAEANVTTINQLNPPSQVIPPFNFARGQTGFTVGLAGVGVGFFVRNHEVVVVAVGQGASPEPRIRATVVLNADGDRKCIVDGKISTLGNC